MPPRRQIRLPRQLVQVRFGTIWGLEVRQTHGPLRPGAVLFALTGGKNFAAVGSQARGRLQNFIGCPAPGCRAERVC